MRTGDDVKNSLMLMLMYHKVNNVKQFEFTCYQPECVNKWVSHKWCFMALGRVSHSFRGTTYPGKTQLTPRKVYTALQTTGIYHNSTKVDFKHCISSQNWVQNKILSDNISRKQRSSLKTLPVKGETDSTGHSKVRLVKQPHPVSGSLADQPPLHLPTPDRTSGWSER